MNSAWIVCIVSLATAGSPFRSHDLCGKTICELDALFAAGSAESLPVGCGRGTILLRTDGKRFKKRLDGAVWKGKCFHCDGSVVNRWVGFKAIRGCATLGTSWADGRPCVVLEYARGTPIFANARDELREISPGVWLGRFYARCPCGNLEGYFVLDFDCR